MGYNDGKETGYIRRHNCDRDFNNITYNIYYIKFKEWNIQINITEVLFGSFM